jgi:hypothetical protein
LPCASCGWFPSPPFVYIQGFSYLWLLGGSYGVVTELISGFTLIAHSVRSSSHNCHFGSKLSFSWLHLELSVKSPSVSPPYPLFQWYLQSKEIFIETGYEMLKLSIWCTRFRRIIRVSCTGRSSENICKSLVQALRKNETQDETLSLPPKLVEKLVRVPVTFSFVKFSFPVKLIVWCPIMPKLAQLVPSQHYVKGFWPFYSTTRMECEPASHTFNFLS